MTLVALLRAATDALHDTNIPFMLTGSVATAFHGASRATMDIDFVIDPTTAQPAEFFGTSLHVATLEDLLLSKLEWAKLGASARQIDDARALLRIRAGDVDVAYIERWIDVLGVRMQWELASTDA